MASKELFQPKIASKEPKASTQWPVTATSQPLLSDYSNRVVLKTLLERRDGGAGLLGERLVIGGWVKSSKVVRKEPVSPPPPPAQTTDGPGISSGAKDVTCVEILKSRVPLFRSIMKILGSSDSAGVDRNPIREKLEPVIPGPPRAPIVCLLVNDGSCASSLQVMVESSIASHSQLMPIGTCLLAKGVLSQPSIPGKHAVELKVEKILHIGTVLDEDKYPLSKKRLPLETLRDFSHIRPRTTTVASVMRICSALTFATHTFCHNKGFLCVQLPIITTTDGEGFSEKFQVTTILNKAAGKMEEPKTIDDPQGVSLEVVKAALKEKSNTIEKLKRSENNKDALAAALLDLRKTNQLAAQLESKGKQKSGTSRKAEKVDFSEDFFSQPTYLTVSGLLQLESYACALGNVYAFGPRFRADTKESAKHAAEMWMVEVEMAFSQLEDAINCAGDYFKFLCKWILENCSQDMKFVLKRIDKTSIDRLQLIIACSFAKISYMEAVDILKEVTDRTFETKLEWGIALTAEHLSYLADEIYKRPVIVYNFPKEIKPFYVRLNDDRKTVAAFDMVVPKVGTIITGSENEERLDMLDARIKELGLPKDQYEWYLDLRRNGTVKHSGFSVAFDLVVLFTTGLADVRDVIPFSRSHRKANN